MRHNIGKPPNERKGLVATETCEAIARLSALKKGKAPTRKELAVDLGLSSVATVIERLIVLKKHGYVDYEVGELWSLRLTAAGRELVRIAAEEEAKESAVAIQQMSSERAE